MSSNTTLRRKNRVRYKIKKKANGRIRLSVHRSNQHISVQLIDDSRGITLASATTNEKELSGLKSTCNIEAAKKVGALIAKRAKKVNVSEVVFDKGSYLFHGKVKALADEARNGGLLF